jgi:hypothetical protein
MGKLTEKQHNENREGTTDPMGIPLANPVLNQNQIWQPEAMERKQPIRSTLSTHKFKFHEQESLQGKASETKVG